MRSGVQLNSKYLQRKVYGPPRICMGCTYTQTLFAVHLRLNLRRLVGGGCPAFYPTMLLSWGWGCRRRLSKQREVWGREALRASLQSP